MIKFREQVPSVYVNASRDFQYLGWLIDIVLNSVKHNVDSLYDLPNTKADPRLAELLAMTLGFKVKRNYDQKQLAALVAVLPRILKYKGTLAAVSMAGEALIAASGASGNIFISVADCELKVSLPKNLVDISLFTDLLQYILPAGMTCRVVRTDIVGRRYATEVGYNDLVFAELIPDIELDGTKQNSTGLATLFDVGSDLSEFANYRYSDTIGTNNSLYDQFNAGLLMNTVVPSLDDVVTDSTETADMKKADEANGDAL